MRAGDDDLVGVRFDVALPRLERVARVRTGRIAAVVAAALGRAAVVAVAHHEKEDVAGGEAVALPRPFGLERPPVGVDARVLGAFARRVDPLPEPPLRVFARSARVVIAE